MNFVGLEPSGELLVNLNGRCLADCEQVLAAIPYAEHGHTELLLFGDAMRLRKPVKFYGRIDGTCPIDPKVLAWFLKRQSWTADVDCRLVPHWLHAKVIWWVGVGAYIGSANLTDRAWNQNFEAGIFIEQSDLDADGITQQLYGFFDQIDERSIPLDEEIYKDQLDLSRQLSDVRERENVIRRSFEAKRNYLNDFSSPITHKPKRGTFELRRRRFVEEWQETMAYLRPLAERVAANESRPDWIPEGTPPSVQCDQFLHAFYYNVVNPRSEKDAYLRFFEKNKAHPESAFQEALAWWKQAANYGYADELDMMAVRAPAFQRNFAEDRILTLGREEFAETLAYAHAFGMHSTRMSVEELGFKAPPGSWPKIIAHGNMIYDLRSKNGRFTGPEVFKYVIWGPGDVASRIWAAVHDDDYQLDRIGPSTFGEVVGWTRPDDFPPRNQRTNKAIKALGKLIKIAL